MFILHSSNKTENLLAHLCAVIEQDQLTSPFAKEIFLIQSQGMERWLSQQLASHFQVFANFEFLFPGRFFSALAQKVELSLSDSDFDRHLMLWRLEALLRQSTGPEMMPIGHYLAGDDAALKRYQLAQQLAQLFDQYQIMRPDMLEAWQQDRDFYGNDCERWQMRLWQGVVDSIGVRHRGSLWLEVIALLNDAEFGTYSDMLPERIFVFGLNTMPPLFLNYLQSLSKHCQLHLFLLNPAQDYWADLAGKRQRVLNEISDGNPLLSAMGQQGREFQEMLLELAEFDFEPESFEMNDAQSVLQHVQNDILNNSNETGPLELDNSIAVHACHSRMREVEVLKDQLLMVLERDSTLQLRDIVVMAPNIEAYEPFVSAVFHDVQHAVADRSLRLSNRLLDAFIAFLNLGHGRFGWQGVLDLLDRPVVYPSFGLTEHDLELIRFWLKETRVRWGRSAEHKKDLGLPELDANTWQASLDRMLMGYAVGSDEHFVDGILPYPDIEGSSALALGGLSEFVELLFQSSRQFKQAGTIEDWAKRLFTFAERLFSSGESAELQEFYQILTILSDQIAPIHRDDVELTVIIAWLESMMSERKSSTGFLRGQLTFCSMLPMRSIPFRIIALLGMNEGEFPKLDRQPSFDLLPQHFRKGDRSHRADDRYQFLEILLSAREQLIITYVGQSIRTNAPIPPSVVVAELLDVMTQQYSLSGLITRHPLQSFSTRYFDGLSSLFSFSRAGLETARALSVAKTGGAIPDVWWRGGLDQPESEPVVVELDELFRFFQHPQRYFMRRQLGLRFTGLDIAAEEREPFTIDFLDWYEIAHDWIRDKMHGRERSINFLQARGRWPLAALGELDFDRYGVAVDRFVDRIHEKNPGLPQEDWPVDIDIGGYRLVGKLGSRYERCGLIYRMAELKGKDFIGAWLHHLIANRIGRQMTHLLSTDEALTFLPDTGRNDDLPCWLEIYREGLARPDAIFVEASMVYVRQAEKLIQGGRSNKSALECAREYWFSAINQAYEPELGRLYGHLQDPGSILDEKFERQCLELLLPVWQTVCRTE